MQQNCIKKIEKLKKLSTSFYDILGISSAFICLIHCLIFPILAIIPLGLNHNPLIDFFFASMGLFAVIKIMKKSSLLVSATLVVSISIIWLSILSDIIFEIHLDMIYVGGIGMIIGHLLNYAQHKKQNH